VNQTNPGAVTGAALFLAIGLGVGGALVGKGFREGRASDRYVTVKGLAEQVVQADVAIWTLRVSAGGADLAKVQGKIDADVAALGEFLVGAGIEADAIRPQRLEVEDALAQPWRTAPVGEARYTIAQTVIVRTEKVDLIAQISRRTGELVRRGIVLNDQGGPVYVFTRLNDVKPEMIAAATRNAREGAEKFAADSQSEIAGIRRATQGLFQILPRDESPAVAEPGQVEKKIRVVTTIEYLLED
jgi:hypothetical protein